MANRDRAESLRRLAHDLRGHNKLSEAIETLRHAKSINATSAAIAHDLGMLLSESGDRSAARRVFRDAARRFPDKGWIRQAYAAELLHIGLPHRALPHARVGVELCNRHPVCLTRLADCELQVNGPHAAEPLYREALRGVRGTARPWVRDRLLACLARLGRWPDAERIAASILRTAPDDYHAAIIRITACLALGRTLAARRCAHRLLIACYECPEANYIAGTQLLAAGLPTLATTHLARACQLDDQNSTFWTNYAAALLMTEDWEGASTAAETALKLNPDDAFAWCNLGDARFALGNLEGAVVAFEMAVHADPIRHTRARSRLRATRARLRTAGGGVR